MSIRRVQGTDAPICCNKDIVQHVRMEETLQKTSLKSSAD